MKRIYKTLLIALLLFAFGPGYGKSTPEFKLDSLGVLLAQTSDDSTRWHLLMEMFEVALPLNLEKAKGYLKQTDEFLTERKCACCYLGHQINWGIYFEKKGELKTAEAKNLDIIAKYEGASCWKKHGTAAYNNLGLVYLNMGKLDKAVEYMTCYSDAAEAAGNTEDRIPALNTLGTIYYKLNDYDQAEAYYHQALDLALSAGTENNVATVRFNLGTINWARKDYQGALESFQTALAIGESSRDSVNLPTRYNNVGAAHLALDNWDLAMRCFKKAKACAEITGNRGQQINAVRNIAIVAEARGDFDVAIHYVHESLDYYREIGSVASILKAYVFLARLYASSGKYQMAFETQKEYSALADSTAQARLDGQMAEQLAAFEATRLKLEKDSIQSALTISEQAGVIKDLQLSKYAYTVAGLAGLLALMLVLVLLVIRSNKLKQNLRLAELKHTVLRARMNPHFLFNALNSIQNAILNRDKLVAYEYHAKFSDLMRMILMHSDQKTIKLNEEITALKLYLDLEQFRTGQGFAYTITLAPEIDPSEQKIPSMLLQPFVENAIWHGVLNRETPGNIAIQITRESGLLKCSIEDDGVGREAAHQLRNAYQPQHASVATQLTQDRLSLFREQYGKQIGLKITDKKDGAVPTGTLVELTIQLSN